MRAGSSSLLKADQFQMLSIGFVGLPVATTRAGTKSRQKCTSAAAGRIENAVTIAAWYNLPSRDPELVDSKPKTGMRSCQWEPARPAYSLPMSDEMSSNTEQIGMPIIAAGMRGLTI